MNPESSPTRRVLISGASIAGPALAYWLTRYGFSCTIIERAPELRAGGYAVDVRGAAVEVVKKMGLFDEFQTHETGTEKVTFVDEHSRPLISIPADIFGSHQPDDLEVMRGDIAQVLYEATRHSTRYMFNDSITSLTETPAGVEVTFEHADPLEFDIVVGADGVHSNVRRLTFGDEQQFVKPLGAYISIATIPNYLHLKNEEVIYGEYAKSAGLYTARDNDELKAMLLFNAPRLQYDRHDIAAQKQIIATTFQETLGWEIPKLLQEMTQASDFYFDAIAQVQLPTWHKGRIAVIGDAAHCPSPASGQGTSIAIVGAYVLAGELKKAHGDHMLAFTAYQSAMQHFIDQNLKIAPITLKGMIAPSKLNLRLRNIMFHVPSLFISMNKQVMNLIQKAANAIRIEDY